MKRIVAIISIVLSLVSCNKVELKDPCNCQVTYEKELFGSWYVVTESDLTPLVIDTLLDCRLDGQVKELEEFNYTRREIITCN